MLIFQYGIVKHFSLKASECSIGHGGGLGKERYILPFHCSALLTQQELQITPTILMAFIFS